MDGQASTGALHNGQTMDETMRELARMPFFMTDINDAACPGGENILLDALQALQYEGSKVEVAQNFKEQGNEMVKRQKWTDAKEFYTKAITVLLDKSEDRWETRKNSESEHKQEEQLLEQCYINRAFCHLELKNCRSTTVDCAAAIRLNPANVKAHYRSASALLALNKIVEALDMVSRGLELDPSNKALKRLEESVQARQGANEKDGVLRAAEQQKKQAIRMTLAAALRARNVKLRGSRQALDLEDAEIHLSPDPTNPRSVLVFPAVLLYPMHAKSDFVKHFAENDSIMDHLRYILPLPWDCEHEYQIQSISCYMDTTSRGMVKIGKKVSLLEALATGATEVVDGLVRIHVVPAALTEQWIRKVKRRKGGEG